MIEEAGNMPQRVPARGGVKLPVRQAVGGQEEAGLLGDEDTKHDDMMHPIEKALRMGTTGFGWCLLLFWLGGVLVAMKHENVMYIRNVPYFLVLTPVWLGDAVALLHAVRIVLLVRSLAWVNYQMPQRRTASDYGAVSQERRNFVGQRNGRLEVDFAFNVVARRLLVRAAMAVVATLLLAGWQGLWCRRLAAGQPGALAAASPLLILEGFALAQTVMFDTHGSLEFVFWLLAAALTTFVALKQGGVGPVAEWRWVEVLAPLWALDGFFLLCAAYVAANACVARYVLTRRQSVCLGMYSQAAIAVALGALMLSFPPVAELTPRAAVFRVHIPLLLLLGGAGVALLAYYLILEAEADRAFETAGYEDPTPLSRTQAGWDKTGGGLTTWTLLGAVEKAGGRGGLVQRTRARHMAAAGAGGAGGIGGESVNDSPGHSDGYEREGFQRTNSGQYDDPNWE